MICERIKYVTQTPKQVVSKVSHFKEKKSKLSVSKDFLLDRRKGDIKSPKEGKFLSIRQKVFRFIFVLKHHGKIRLKIRRKRTQT